MPVWGICVATEPSAAVTRRLPQQKKIADIPTMKAEYARS
jgi:hypothetical protein